MKRYLFLIALTLLCACGKGNNSDGEDADYSSVSASKLADIPAKDRVMPQIYQVNPKLYGTSGAFGKIQLRLDEIKALGTDVLYLMPVYEQGREKSLGSPYCIRNYKAVNTSYGSLEGLRSLVNAAHAKGMKVMFDWVANHTAWDHPWISEHPDWYVKDGSGNIVSPTADGVWNDVALLDYNSTELRAAMTDAMLYWVKELGIDGYRCDYAHGPSGRQSGPMDEFWISAIAELRSEKADLLMLAESDFTKMYGDGFDIIFSRSSKASLISSFGSGDMSGFVNTAQSALSSAPAPCSPLLFITNHDDATSSTPIKDFKSAEGALAAFLLMRSLPSATMLYGSQEIGYDKTINFFNVINIDWHSNNKLLDVYKKSLSAFAKIPRSGTATVYTAGRAVLVHYSGGSLFAVNLGDKALSVSLPSAVSSSPVKLDAFGWAAKEL